MIRGHPRSTRTYTVCPYMTLFRSRPAIAGDVAQRAVSVGGGLLGPGRRLGGGLFLRVDEGPAVALAVGQRQGRAVLVEGPGGDVVAHGLVGVHEADQRGAGQHGLGRRIAGGQAQREQGGRERSEERRGGQACVRTCRSWWSAST